MDLKKAVKEDICAVTFESETIWDLKKRINEFLDVNFNAQNVEEKSGGRTYEIVSISYAVDRANVQFPYSALMLYKSYEKKD